MTDPDIFNHTHAEDRWCASCELDLQAQPIPRRAHLPGRGMVRILSYDGNDRFTVLTNRDIRVSVHRDRLSFRK